MVIRSERSDPAQEKPEQERKRAEVFYKRSQKTV